MYLSAKQKNRYKNEVIDDDTVVLYRKQPSVSFYGDEYSVGRVGPHHLNIPYPTFPHDGYLEEVGVFLLS